MSSKVASPTASALRSSRLFSIPQPLQRSDTVTSGLTGKNNVSNTATAPWPTQQAITAPRASIAKGDWGMKRALPSRSTARTSTPAIKLHAVDTREHITDFDSASDHVRTLAKFQELRLPLTRPRGLFEYESVFEPQDDHTDPDGPIQDPATNKTTSRWKHSSPDLGRVNERNFQKFLEGAVSSKQSAFMDFLRQKAIANLEADRGREARHSGEGGKEVAPITEISEAQFDDYKRQLRTSFVGGSGTGAGTLSNLSNLIREFLDIPGAKREHTADSMSDMIASSQAPMHPSAGLGYLRTDAILTNNPIFGPQARVTPHPARVLAAAQNAPRISERIGLAGFVVESGDKLAGAIRREATSRTLTFQPTDEEIEAARNEDKVTPAADTKSEGIGVKGGNRFWAEPRAAQLDSEGHVVLTARNAPEGSIKGHTMDPTFGGRYTAEQGLEQPSRPEDQGAAAIFPGGQPGRRSQASRSAGGRGSHGAFGLGTLRQNDAPRDPEAGGVDMGDDELQDSSMFKNLPKRK